MPDSGNRDYLRGAAPGTISVKSSEGQHVGNRQVIENYARAIAADDSDAQGALLAEDYILEYPQSGERIRGWANKRAMLEQYPGRETMKPTFSRIIGADDEFVTSPMWNMIHLAGSGDEFQLTGTIRYPDGQTWHAVALVTLRGGKIWRETDFFGPPFEAPEWRSEWVERMDGTFTGSKVDDDLTGG